MYGSVSGLCAAGESSENWPRGKAKEGTRCRWNEDVKDVHMFKDVWFSVWFMCSWGGLGDLAQGGGEGGHTLCGGKSTRRTSK